MEAEDLVVDEGGERQVVKEVGEVLPNIGVAIFPKAFVIKAIHLRDLTGFVITAEDGDALGVSDFESNEEGDSLY